MSVNVIKVNPLQMLGPKIEIPVPKKGWIAGGAIRRWFAGGEPLSDVDCFFQNEQAFLDHVNEVLQHGAKLINTHKNAVTFELNDVLVQLIKIKFHPTVESLLDSFDFTVCQFAWDGTEIYSTPQAVISTLRKHLGAHILTKEFSVDSLRRAFKYCKKGYHPCNGTVQQIANSLRTLTEAEIQQAVEISPNGGKRIIRVD
jgi:hypothetical protein